MTDPKGEELADQGEGAALAGDVLVAGLAPRRRVALQLPHIEAHLGHEAAHADHAVDVVQHGLHRPVAQDGGVGFRVLHLIYALLVMLLNDVHLEVPPPLPGS